MKKKANYIPLESLEVYQLARQLSKITWRIYNELEWRGKKIMGDQFVESTDSVGANIAEGYHRYHYLDRIKFYYNSRASLSEANAHWIELLKERKMASKDEYTQFKKTAKDLSVKLNNFISTTYKAVKNKPSQ